LLQTQKNIWKLEISTFEIGNWYFNLTNSLQLHTDTNGYCHSNLKICYKLYKDLRREVKITQKCSLQQSKEFESSDLHIHFAFLLNVVRFFFTELLNIESKVFIFASTFNNSMKKKSYNKKINWRDRFTLLTAVNHILCEFYFTS